MPLAIGRGQPGWVSLLAAEGFGLYTLQLLKGDPLQWQGESQEFPEPCTALGKGVLGATEH